MIVAGCDVGSLTAKAVVLKDDKIMGARVISGGVDPSKVAKRVMEMALNDAGIKMDVIEFVIGTGYGRKKIPFISETKSEISCHAKGASFLMPSVKTVIDIGGQDCKVMKMDQTGHVEKFITNDKCAAGTGRFLEVMAKALDVSLDELGRLYTKAKKTIPITSMCTVWAQAEVIRLLNDGEDVADIGATINDAMAARVALIANALGLEKDVCMTGGVSKNEGVRKILEKKLGVKIRKPRVDPQLIGALGAAIFAGEKVRREVK